MSVPASALPRAAQVQLAGLQAAAAAAATPPAAPTNPAATAAAPTAPTPTTTTTATVVTPPVATPPAEATPPAGEQITLSREEYNALKAGRDARVTAEGRAEALQLELDEARHALTQRETPAKATPQAPAATATALPEAPAVTFTDEEETAFGDSREFITKVATLAVRSALAPILEQLNTRIETIGQAAQTAASSVSQNNQRTFLSQVQTNVPNMQEIINHKHWGDFTKAIDPMAGATYGALLAYNIQEQRLEQVTNIYKKFAAEYIAPSASNVDAATAAYAGGIPTGNATPKVEPTQAAKLKFSDRKKASLDYRHGRITAAELEQVANAFQAADKLGNVDYNA